MPTPHGSTRLCGAAVRAFAHHGTYNFILARRADVGSAAAECLGPKFVVGEAMSADDGKGGELLMQPLNFARGRGLDIEDQDPGPVARNCGKQFVAIAGKINGKRLLGKTGYQGLRSSGVILIENYIEWSHTSP
jgi:hypothetical protein